MKLFWRLVARGYQVRANRLRAKAAGFDLQAEKFFRRIKGAK